MIWRIKEELRIGKLWRIFKHHHHLLLRSTLTFSRSQGSILASPSLGTKNPSSCSPSVCFSSFPDSFNSVNVIWFFHPCPFLSMKFFSFCFPLAMKALSWNSNLSRFERDVEDHVSTHNIAYVALNYRTAFVFGQSRCTHPFIVHPIPLSAICTIAFM